MSTHPLTPEQRRAISRKGGLAVPAQKRSFSRNRELAREAGRKGGLTPKKREPKLAAAESNTLMAKLSSEIES